MVEGGEDTSDAIRRHTNHLSSVHSLTSARSALRLRSGPLSQVACRPYSELCSTLPSRHGETARKSAAIQRKRALRFVFPKGPFPLVHVLSKVKDDSDVGRAVNDESMTADGARREVHTSLMPAGLALDCQLSTHTNLSQISWNAERLFDYVGLNCLSSRKLRWSTSGHAKIRQRADRGPHGPGD
jgi:hypothetical protein